MAFYKCPDCSIYWAPEWGLLKGHMVRLHKREDLKGDQVKEDAFKEYEITEEEYNALAHPSLTSQNPPPKTPPKTVPQNVPPKTDTDTLSNPLVEEIHQYSEEPTERLREVLLANGGNAGTVQIVTRIASLSPWMCENPYELEGLLTAHFIPPKTKVWITGCVAQYIRGLDVGNDDRGSYPYNYGQPHSYGQPGYHYPYPNNRNEQFVPMTISPEVAEMRAELARLRAERQEERQKAHDDLLLNRITDLEKKLEAGIQPNPLLEKIKELEAKLAGGGKQSMMVMYDEQGHPMQLPADQGIIEAIRNKTLAETEIARTQQMIQMMTAMGGNTDKLEPVLAQMKEDRESANKRIEDLTKAITDQKITHLEERVKAAETLAANPPGDGKGVLDLAGDAGTDLKDGALVVAKEIKEGVTKGFDSLKEILSGKSAAPIVTKPRSPEEIGEIMKAENMFLDAIGQRH